MCPSLVAVIVVLLSYVSCIVGGLLCEPPSLLHQTKEGLSRCCVPADIPPGMNRLCLQSLS